MSVHSKLPSSKKPNQRLASIVSTMAMTKYLSKSWFKVMEVGSGVLSTRLWYTLPLHSIFAFAYREGLGVQVHTVLSGPNLG